MQIEYAPAFLRIIKKLDPYIKEGVKDTVTDIIDYYENGQKTLGLGVRHLKANIWEARCGLKVRVLYKLEKNSLKFILAGSHDDIKNFLKG